MKFDFSQEKNDLLFNTRGITFYQIIESISEKGILLNIKHPNEKDYPNQKMMVVEYNDYTYCVPYVIDGDTWFLKTIFPNRKFLYLIEKKEDQNG